MAKQAIACQNAITTVSDQGRRKPKEKTYKKTKKGKKTKEASPQIHALENIEEGIKGINSENSHLLRRPSGSNVHNGTSLCKEQRDVVI
ncbi:hypothetical protein Tco_1470873 [Tanacetum coccineum]